MKPANDNWIIRLRRIAPERLLLGAMLVLAVVLWVVVIRQWPRPLEVVSFAVGEGDAFLVRSPSGRTLLIDGGSRDQQDVGERNLLPNLLLLGVHRIDAILISHPDSDHLNGIQTIMDAIPVGMILDPEIPCDTTAYQKIIETAQAKKIPHLLVRGGDLLNLGASVKMQILYPYDPLLTGTRSDTNNNAVVGMLTYRNARMLFTGDLEDVGERALMSHDPDLHADVLKVAHHGSKFGTTGEFLEAVRPQMALLSCSGSTVSEHPHPELLARLRHRNIQLWRTDVSGQIELTTDGQGWKVRTYRTDKSGE